MFQTMAVAHFLFVSYVWLKKELFYLSTFETFSKTKDNLAIFALRVLYCPLMPKSVDRMRCPS